MVFDGKKLAQKILEGLKKETSVWPKKPSVAVISFGDKTANSSYIAQKRKTAGFLNFAFNHYHYSESDFPKARDYLNKIARFEKHTAVVVQMPLPPGVNPAVLNIVPIEKDPDLLSDRAVGMFFNGRSLVNPPTPSAILKILKESGVNLSHKKIVIFGYGRLVGRFLVPALVKEDGVVTVIEKGLSAPEVLSVSREADIIISAVGQPNLIKADMVKDGLVVIDAGFSLVDPVRGRELSDALNSITKQRPSASNGIDGKITGDVEFDSVSKKASLITPVPGGVGPVSVAELFSNVVQLFKAANF
ncbi:MAG: bifunctional 5,10-methylenetetrahydrofolate dehydrogenase/5,10-methenyltetrahydrofolate cyclohydrolase [Patescibacteria group bacterium]|mgnify:FL=1